MIIRIVITLLLFLSTASPSWAVRLFTCGFEENNLSATAWNSAGAGAAVSTTSPHSGTYRLNITGSSAKNVTRQLATSYTSGTLYYRFYFNTNNVGTADSKIFQNQGSGGSANQAVQVTRVNGGTIRLTNAVTTTATTTTATISTGTWYRIEIRHLVADAGGEMELRLYLGDSTSAIETLTITGEDTNNTNVRDFLLQEGAANAGIENYFDDVAVNDSTGSFQTSWAGVGKIYLLTPDTEVTGIWTPLSGTDNALMVDDVPGTPDDDTTYNSDTTINNEDRLGLTALGAEVTSDATITLAHVNMRARGDGTAGTRQMRLVIWDEASTQTNGPTSTRNDSTTYAVTPVSETLVLDTTGKTKANVASFDVGYEPLTTHNSFVTAVWVNVEWKEAAGTTPRGMLLGVYP